MAKSSAGRSKKPKQPSLIAMANAKLDEVRAALRWVFDVASINGDDWSAATVTAVRRVLGNDADNSKLTIHRKSGR